jgi:sodium pump decarboxylase gamma subunit
LEILQTSLKVTILGMGIVFVALIGLVLIIMAMHRLTGNKKDDRKKISVEKADTVSEQKAELADSAVQQISMDEDSKELVAVITAAIAASLHRSTHDIVVRSIRRIPAITPVWNRTSRQEQVSARL